MTIRLSIAARNAALNAVAARVDNGASNGTLKIYTGSQPANADTAASGTLLVTIALADPSFESPATGVMAMDADPDLTGTAVATGTAGWARVADSDSNSVYDGTVGTSGVDFTINTTSIVTGQVITLATSALTFPV